MNGEQPTYFFKTLDSKTLFVTRTWEGKTFSHTFEVGQRYFTKQYQRCVEIISLQDQYHNTDCGYYFKAKYVNEDGSLAINGKDITAQATIDSIYHTYQKSFMSAHEIEGNGLSFLEAPLLQLRSISMKGIEKQGVHALSTMVILAKRAGLTLVRNMEHLGKGLLKYII